MGKRVSGCHSSSAVAACIQPGTVVNEIMSGEDWFPTLLAAAGDPDVKAKLLQGMEVGDKTFKVHLNAYNVLPFLPAQAMHAIHAASRRAEGAERKQNQVAMKNLLVVTALLEIITGLALIVSPALPVSLLIGARA